ncbi:MAG: phasin family protein [Betaproteobacteria bacterium]|nr:phasin family protein [Rhodocyclales bacterium]
MYKISEQLANANKAGVETFATIANTAFASAERVAALNLNAARTLLEDSADNARALFSVKDVQGLVSLQDTLGQPGLDKATAYSRSVYDIATQTQEALSRVVKAQFSELNKNLGLALDKAAKTGPAGSDVTVNAIKSALSAANSAYDSMTEAAKQATEMAEAKLIATATAIRATRKAS